MYTYVHRISLHIPAYWIEEMYQRLLAAYNQHFKREPLEPRATISERVRFLLYAFGYETSVDPITHAIVFQSCKVEELRPKTDVVLRALDGITPAGSYLMLSDEENGQYAVRYNLTQHWLQVGYVTFPPDKHQYFPRSYLPGKKLLEEGKVGSS